MRVLVTGAGGTLGKALIPRLVEAGHEAVAFDIRDVEVPADAQFVRGDVRSPRDVELVARETQLIVHSAAIHGIHLATHSRRDFYDLNVTGTFNVWQAAVASGIMGVVFCSTMGVYGESRRPPSDSGVAVVHEDVPLLPGDVYGWTKVVGEQMSRLHWQADGIPSVSLRLGMFVPEPFLRYGIRLLYGGVHEDDVAGAVMTALEALVDRRLPSGCEAFNVESPLPFGPADDPDLRHDPLSAVERHWPGSVQLLRQRGVSKLKPVEERFDVSRIQQRLGFRPVHDFGAWLTQLAAQPEIRTETDPPWP